MGANDNTRPNHPLHVRPGWIPVGKPLAYASMGGRDLPRGIHVQAFSDWVRHGLEEELERTWETEMNGIDVTEAYASAAG